MRIRLAYVFAVMALLAGCARPAPAPAPTPAPEAPAPEPVPQTEWRAGIWLERRWAESESPGSVAAMVADLAGKGITDLYVRTGPYQADGSVPLPPAERVATLQRAASERGLRLWAWLPGLRTRLDLSDPARVARATAAGAELAALGFDGVHLDIEPTPDGDPGYLALLDGLRGALPEGSLLGVATHLIQPTPPRAEWSPEYFAEVARRVDQAAVMAYDTYAESPTEYRGFVSAQTLAALANSPAGTEVLIGIPTYEDRTERHTPEREPTGAALEGAAEGFAAADLGGRTTGWAIFAGYTMDEKEWALFTAARPRSAPSGH